jgi:tripartite-type tricarboxylate transporter receptor subunit TctC
MTRNGLTRRKLATWVAATGVVSACGRRAEAQQHYPTRPVRLILPFGPAGVADVTARLAAEKLGHQLGQRFIIETSRARAALLPHAPCCRSRRTGTR